MAAAAAEIIRAQISDSAAISLPTTLNASNEEAALLFLTTAAAKSMAGILRLHRRPHLLLQLTVVSNGFIAVCRIKDRKAGINTAFVACCFAAAAIFLLCKLPSVKRNTKKRIFGKPSSGLSR